MSCHHRRKTPRQFHKSLNPFCITHEAKVARPAPVISHKTVFNRGFVQASPKKDIDHGPPDLSYFESVPCEHRKSGEKALWCEVSRACLFPIQAYRRYR